MASQSQSSISEIPPVTVVVGNVVTTVNTDVGPSVVTSTPTLSSTQRGPILTYVGPQGPPGTPMPLENVPHRPIVPLGFSIPWNNQEQPYGMPTTFMTNLQNANSTYSNPRMNITSPLQGYGSAINTVGRINPQVGTNMLSQASNFTNDFAQVMRQQMDESNNEMVQMLAQTKNTVFNPLIQDTINTNR